MKQLLTILAVLLCMVVILWGCQRTTTVILPPEASGTTGSAASPTAESSVFSATESGTAASAAPTDAPSTAPSSPPITDSPTLSPEKPSTSPATEPASKPATEPAATTAPTTMPASEPVTEPSSEPESHPVYDISTHTIGSLEYSLLDRINQQRADAELPPLSMDSILCALAAIRSYECSINFSHTRPDGRGAYSVLSDYGYDFWSYLDERIHYGSTGLPAGTIIKGWMGNTDFSASILSEAYTHIGIGVYTGDGGTYITCLFAG